MEKVKETLGMGHKKAHHQEHERVHDAEGLPRQYETRTETVEKVPQMRTEQRTEHVPRMHERQEEVMVPKHKIVMEKETRTVPEMHHEAVQREVNVPTGEYRERVVDHNRHPGADTHTGAHTGVGTHTGAGLHTGAVGERHDLGTETHGHEHKSTMQKIKEKVHM